MNINEHRKAIVRSLIRGLKEDRKNNKLIRNSRHISFICSDELELHGVNSTVCVATKLLFPETMTNNTICCEVGDLWLGLWLDCEVRICEIDGYGMYPRWLAEVLREECDLRIDEVDVYDV